MRGKEESGESIFTKFCQRQRRAKMVQIVLKPLDCDSNTGLNEKAPSTEGWKTLPSWYVVGDGDMVIPPPLQMMMAERAKAHITHVHGSHPSMIEHPEATVAAIMVADKATEALGGEVSAKLTACDERAVFSG